MRKAARDPAHDPARDPAQDAVRLEALTRLYGTGGSAGSTVTALRAVDLAFPRGSFTAVMGPSGSGKSTLLQCAAGLDRPTSGRAHIDGTDITELSETRLTELRRRSTGFVFQAFNLLPSLTAAQNVALPMRLAGRRPDRGPYARRWPRSVWRATPVAAPVSCRAVSSNGWRSPARW